MELFNKAFTGIAAAVLGWLLVSLPKVTRNVMSWKIMISSIGVAAVVGFVTNSIISMWLPSWPEDIRCSIAAIMGASCDQWIIRYDKAVKNMADKVEKTIIDTIGGDENEEESQLNEGPEKDSE